MQLESIALNLRRRSAWEALDLGAALTRVWALPAYRAWLASFWSVGIVLLLLLHDTPGLAVAILWWMKPAFDRILLLAYSRALFSMPTRSVDLLRALPGLIRRSGMIAALLWRRFDFARSFHLPVWQLEGQGGRGARARLRVLQRKTRGYAVWLTFVCANLVGVLWLSQIFLLEFLLPAGSEGIFRWSDWWDDTLPPWKEMLSILLWMVAESIIEPFYVASGFSLYLNRRSDLEGWDIEIAFRRMARRLATTARPLATLVATLGLACAVIPDAEAAAPTDRAGVVIREVLADPVFGQEVESTDWRLRERKAEAPPVERAGWFDTLQKLVEWLAEALRGALWVAAALAAAALLAIILRTRDRWLPGSRRRAPPPDFLFGLDVRPDSLPGDIVGAARQAFAAGRWEEGMSLLYRGALVALIHRLHVEFRAGDTEGDCLRRVGGRLDGEALAHFAALLDTWQRVAYARRFPAMPALDALCADWSRHFGSGGRLT